MSLEQNLKYAEFGLKKCREKFSLGGLNIRKNFDDLRKSKPQTWVSQLSLLRRYEILSKNKIIHGKLSPDEERELERLSDSLIGGLCVLLSTGTRKILLQEYPNLSVEYVQTNDHQFLVIGRSENSNREDIKTWGEAAVICDPWAGISYPAAKFFEIQNGPSISYYNMDQDHGPVACEDHYLMGIPVAVEPELLSAEIMFQAAAEHGENKEFIQAIKIFERAKLIYEKLTYAQIAYAQCCTNMASCYSGLKQYGKALASYEIVLRIYEAELGLDHEKTKKAEFMRDQFKVLVNSVVSNARRLLLINGNKSANKKDAEKIYKAAIVYFNNQDYQPAIVTIEQALAEFNKLPNCEQNLAICYSTLASCHRELGDYSKAKEIAEIAVKIFELELGSDNTKTIGAKKKLEGIQELLESSNKRKLV